MACKLNSMGYEQYLEDMKKKGYSDTDALAMLPAGAVTSDLVEQIAKRKESTAVIDVALRGEYGTTKKNVIAALVASYPQDILILNGWSKDTDVQKAWNDAHPGANLGALTTVFDQAKALKDPKYLADRLKNGDADAKDMVNTIIVHGKVTEQVKMVNDLVNGGLGQYEIEKLPGNAVLIHNWDTFYSNPKNWNFDKDYITVNDVGTDVTVTLKDKLNRDHKIQVVQQGKLLLPDGTYTDKIPGYYTDKPDGFNKRVIAIDAQRYLKEVIANSDPASIDKVMTEITTQLSKGDFSDWWGCTGIGCEKTKTTGGGGGGAGGGGGGSAGAGRAASVGGVRIVCDKTEAKVWNNGTEIGKVNEVIKLPPGDYALEVRLLGYKTVTLDVKITSYIIDKTAYLVEVRKGITTFINNIGGISQLNENAFLYLFCTYKARRSGLDDWRTIAVGTGILAEVPTTLNANDVLYAYYLLTGDVTKAQKLVADGYVNMDDKDMTATGVYSELSGIGGGGAML